MATERSLIEPSAPNWRAEVEPTLRNVRPRAALVPCVNARSFESLIFAEVGNCHSEWVDGNEFVRHL